MNKRKFFSRLLQACVVLTLGVLILWKQTRFLTVAMFIVSLVVVAGGLAQYGYWLMQNQGTPLRGRRPRQLIAGTLYILLGLAMIFYKELPLFILPILFACYLLLNGTIKLVDTVLCIKNKAGELLYSLFPAIFYLTFAVILLFSPLYHIKIVLIIIGVYCLMLGLNYLADCIMTLIPTKSKQNLKRRVRISLPIFLAAFIPHGVLTKLNEFLSESDERRAEDFEDIELRKTDRPPDLEIFIHVARDGFCAIGHADLCFEGELIAYGNYDEASSLPIGVGDGVLLLSDKEQYIPFCLKFNKTTIFAFGLRLNDIQKNAIRRRIGEIKSGLYEWNTPYAAAVLAAPEKEIDSMQYRDFASWLAHETGAKFYKFHSGKFKTYFVMSTNCVLLADSIVCRAGTDILNPNGIISPGTFYDYLETEFQKPNSMVITREVHTLNRYSPQSADIRPA